MGKTIISRHILHQHFFLVGLCQEHVYHVKINDRQHMKARIRDAVGTVAPNILQTTWNEVEHCLDIRRATKEAHLEIY
jgi:hypothetical protein